MCVDISNALSLHKLSKKIPKVTNENQSKIFAHRKQKEDWATMFRQVSTFSFHSATVHLRLQQVWKLSLTTMSKPTSKFLVHAAKQMEEWRRKSVQIQLHFHSLFHYRFACTTKEKLCTPHKSEQRLDPLLLMPEDIISIQNA